MAFGFSGRFSLAMNGRLDATMGPMLVQWEDLPFGVGVDRAG
jgi:hypothetical protein